MCGIAAILDFDAQPDEALLRRMCAVMEHRGPDSLGVYAWGPVGLGIRRLAIIDVAGGDQPLSNEDGSVTVVMNGEIYNHGELRTSLQRRGHEFRTHADTEVLVHLYEDYGDELVAHLRGMFAFALWDERRGRLLCARDRVGKKPLFYTRRNNRWVFASEVRALLQDSTLSREPSPQAIDAYLALQYVPQPLSAFRAVEKLPPASTMAIDRSGAVTKSYWELDYKSKEDDLGEDERAEQLRLRLWDATRIRLMSEVPLGAFLSGGIDSSAVVAAMADQMPEPVKTFSIGFSDAAWDETKYARAVARRFSTDHHEFQVEPEALSILPRLARHYGEPFADPSAIPSFYLAELAGEHVTVALNGDGGDESFAGYGRYTRGDLLRRIDLVPPALRDMIMRLLLSLGSGGGERSIRNRAQRVARLIAADACGRYATSLVAFTQSARDELYTEEFRDLVGRDRGESFLERAWKTSTACSLVERMLDVDVRTYLPGDLLVKMDVATMAHSVEARSPFLDHELMEWAAALPAHEKLYERTGKRLLKHAMRQWLPPGILERPKMGFGVPLHRWFRDELRQLPAEFLLDPAAQARRWFRPAVIERMIREHHDSVADHSLRLWTLVQLESWHREVRCAPVGAAELA